MTPEGENLTESADGKETAGNEQQHPEQNIEVAGAEIRAVEIPQAVNRPPQQQSTKAQPSEVKREMNEFERSTIKWARVAVLMSGLAALFVCLQWYEMHTGGVDTHDLAVASGKQADRMKDFASAMKDQSDRTTELVAEMKEQSDATNRLAVQTQRSADIARDTYNAANRPYLGVNEVLVTHAERGPDSSTVFRGTPTTKTQMMSVRVVIKNFGTAPALNRHAGWRVFIGGVEQQTTLIPDTPSTQFPGELNSFVGYTFGQQYLDIVIRRTKTLIVQITVSYEWPGNHQQTECTKMQYAPDTNDFLDLGACTIK
jgi:hypothetical protein